MMSGNRRGEKGGGRPRVCVSTCLVGERVRWDGGERRHAFVAASLGRLVELVPVCPEVELGLGVPREPIELVGAGAREPRLLGVTSRRDLTEAMRRFAEERVAALECERICGYVAKSGSPSCGLRGVPIRPPRGRGENGENRHAPPMPTARGRFATVLRRRLPFLPVVEESALDAASGRARFLEQVFACHRLSSLFAGDWTVRDLAEFRSRERLLLRAHGAAIETPREDAVRLVASYRKTFAAALRRPATRTRHLEVLLHAARLVERRLAAPDRRSLRGAIDAYGRGRAPLGEPVRRLRDAALRHGIAELVGQSYLEPWPGAFEDVVP